MNNKINYKLLNLVLIVVLIVLIIKTGNLWLFLLSKFTTIITPILFGFTIAYTLYPFQKFLQKRVGKKLSVVIILFFISLLIFLVIYFIFPLLLKQSIELFNNLIVLIEGISKRHHLDLTFLEDKLNDYINAFISNGAKTIVTSISVVMKIIVMFVTSVYMLIDMEKIREKIKNSLNSKSYVCLKKIDGEITNYFKGFIAIIMITFFEYMLMYLIVGHKNALLLGILAALANFIPHFGALFVNILAISTGFLLGNNIFIKVLIGTFICGLFDSYILNPFVYSKTNQIHPLIVIISAFIGSNLFGFMGLIMSLPITIIIITVLRYFKQV